MRAFIAHLLGPGVQSSLKGKGMEPGVADRRRAAALANDHDCARGQSTMTEVRTQIGGRGR